MSLARFAAPLAIAAAAFAAPAKAQQDDGQLVFNNACRTCHTTAEGDNRLGPSLGGVVGREAGSLEGYSYSSAMAGAGFAWDEEKLDAFIENPDAVVPGHNMKPFPGISDPAQRQAIVSYLAGAS